MDIDPCIFFATEWNNCAVVLPFRCRSPAGKHIESMKMATASLKSLICCRPITSWVFTLCSDFAYRMLFGHSCVLLIMSIAGGTEIIVKSRFGLDVELLPQKTFSFLNFFVIIGKKYADQITHALFVNFIQRFMLTDSSLSQTLCS